MRNIVVFKDTKAAIAPIVELNRNKAASMFEPPINVRTLQNYLELAKVFLPTFQVFEDTDTGGLNRFTKVNLDHIPVLQRMVDYCRSHGLKKLRIELKNNPDYFELGDHTNGYNNQTDGCKVPEHYTQKAAIRVYAKVS